MSKQGVLGKIIERKREDLPKFSARIDKLEHHYTPRDFATHRTDGALKLFCEIKKKSPSAGPLSTKLSVAERASLYADCGASLISVLCDQPFFDGDYSDLSIARSACHAPLLCKEFIIDPIQLELAAKSGADAVLLIVRCLELQQLKELSQAAAELNLKALIEVHQDEELDEALAANARWIGVNERDLDTFIMNREQAARVLARIPSGIAKAHLSGVKTPEDILRLKESGVDAALVGEVLMRLDEPREHLTALFAAARA